MTFDRLKSILVDMNMFTIKGTMTPPNNRVIFDSDPLRIIVTPTESKIMISGGYDWTFYLKHLTIKDLFQMLDEYFPHDDQTYAWTWVDKGFYSSEEWNNFKTKWTREEKLESIIQIQYNMKKTILTLTMFFGFITVSFCDDPPPFNPSGPQGIPIDGGVFALLGAGIGYGVKKVRDSKKSEA